MKHIKLTALCLFMVLCAGLSFSQSCESEYLDSCKKHLSEDHFTFLKSFKLVNEHGEHHTFEYSYMLLEGKKYEYYFEGYKEGGQDVVATLYDPNHKAVATSKKKDNYEHKLVYECKKRGIYYIEFSFKDDNAFCGTASLGFSR